MPPEIAKWLHDVITACTLLEDFTRGKSFADYQADALLRADVEREFITIGEALTQALNSMPRRFKASQACGRSSDFAISSYMATRRSTIRRFGVSLRMTSLRCGKRCRHC
jgi:hypothetical protein